MKIAIILFTISIFGARAQADASQGREQSSPASTKLDFENAMIEGKFQAPQGFFLQGRTAQSLKQMVRLRSNFKEELRRSKSGVEALAK